MTYMKSPRKLEIEISSIEAMDEDLKGPEDSPS